MISNMIYIVALGVGSKCPRKIHLNTQCPVPLVPAVLFGHYNFVRKETSNLYMISYIHVPRFLAA